MLSEAASECEVPSLSRAFGAHALPEQVRIIKAAVDLLFYVVVQAVEAAVLIDLKGVESSLEIRHDDLVAPFPSRIMSIALISTPALKAHALDLPSRYVHHTP